MLSRISRLIRRSPSRGIHVLIVLAALLACVFPSAAAFPCAACQDMASLHQTTQRHPFANAKAINDDGASDCAMPCCRAASVSRARFHSATGRTKSASPQPGASCNPDRTCIVVPFALPPIEPSSHVVASGTAVASPNELSSPNVVEARGPPACRQGAFGNAYRHRSSGLSPPLT